MSTKYVIVERQNMSGRFVAMRGLSFATEADAKAHLATLWQRNRCFVEPRKVADEVEQRMTCQCCGRGILAKLGTIALHGYERPGYGWQTNSCMGAKYLPFEISRDRLADLIHALKNHRTGLKFNRAKVAAEASGYPVTVAWTERNPDSPRGGRLNRSFDFTRVNFADPGTEATTAREHLNYNTRTFDDLLARELTQRDRQIEMLEQDIADHEKRYAGWSQTHFRADGKWMPLIAEGV